MVFTSTRGVSSPVDAPRAIIAGIAPDGGLYVPDAFPSIPVRDIIGMDFYGVARRVLRAFLPGFTDEEIEQSVSEAYLGRFFTPEIAPLTRVGDEYVLELFHGPTAAFKDVALSILPRLMSRAKEKERVTDEIMILTATSGDTGSAALNGFRNVNGIRILVFYPEGGVSPVQRAQMTTMDGRNIGVCGVKGNFDDCQTGVKRVFTGASAPRGVRFSSANSINIGRLVPQIVYYYKAYIDLMARCGMREGEMVDFIVPTGNFGDILAGYFAKMCGLPIGRLVCASNANRVLTDFFQTGLYDIGRPLHKTMSPSMDILISSNLERLLYLAAGRDGEKVQALMRSLKETGAYRADDMMMKRMRADIFVGCAHDEQALRAIGRVYSEHRYLMDPHTAVGWKVLEEYRASGNCARYRVLLSTASPYKFPKSVLTGLDKPCPEDAFDQLTTLKNATGIPIPPPLLDLCGKASLHNDVCAVNDIEKYVMEKAGEKTWHA